MKMVKPKSPRSAGYRRERAMSLEGLYETPYYRRSEDMMAVNGRSVQDAQGTSTSSNILYYTLLSLKVGLWIFFAWVLSHLHLGLPCFLLPLIIWLYSMPFHRALNWAKRRVRGPAGQAVTQG